MQIDLTCKVKNPQEVLTKYQGYNLGLKRKRL